MLHIRPWMGGKKWNKNVVLDFGYLIGLCETHVLCEDDSKLTLKLFFEKMTIKYNIIKK